MNNSGGHHIIGVIKDGKGEITAYKLDNGQLVDKAEGVTMARNGEISGVMVGKSKNGHEYLRSLPDGNDNNNLDSLPEIDAPKY